MALRTEEKLQQLFQERKRIQQRKKERERKKYKKASDANKQKLKKKKNQESQKKHQQQKPLKYTLTIYQTTLIQREPDEKDLYTKEELQNIETLYPNETGRINWYVWYKLKNKLRNNLFGWRG